MNNDMKQADFWCPSLEEAAAAITTHKARREARQAIRDVHTASLVTVRPPPPDPRVAFALNPRKRALLR